MRKNSRTLSTIDRRRHDALAVEDAPCSSAALQPDEQLPLTAALLRVTATAVSFATPGHRSGRSCPADMM
jgi:hypothetical protein